MEDEKKPGVSERHAKIKQMAEAGTQYTELPGVHITPNRLVAYNMAYFRKAAGLKQDEMAEMLNRGREQPVWTNASVSAAERSWDGKRVRQFDADVLLGLATTLGLPLSAFFLPPEDDGVKRRYLMDMPDTGGYSQCMTMWDVLDLVTNTEGFDWTTDDDEEEGSPTLERVRRTNERFNDRLNSARAFYRREEDVTYAQEAWGVPPGETADHDVILEKLERTRYHYESLRQLLGDIDNVQQDLYEQLGMTRREKLPEQVARTVVARYRAKESIEDIASSMRVDPWLVEKALIDAREGYLSYSVEYKTYVFQPIGSEAWNKMVEESKKARREHVAKKKGE